MSLVYQAVAVEMVQQVPLVYKAPRAPQALLVPMGQLVLTVLLVQQGPQVQEVMMAQPVQQEQ